MTDDLMTSQTTSDSSEDAQRVGEIESEIEATRDDLTETVQAIGEKLNPSNLARDAGATVKQAAIGKVDQMSYGAQETWRDITTGNTSGIVDVIKRNPIPTGMAALGIGLLLMNRGQRAQMAAYRSPYEAAWNHTAGQSPMDRVGSTVSGAAEQVGEAASQVGDRVGGVAGSIGQAASELPQQAGDVMAQGTTEARRLLDRYPLAAGAIAVAAGAALGMLLPATEIERETLGEARDDVVGQTEAIVHEALEKAEGYAQA